MYLLPALAAGLVGCFHIDRLDKFSEGVGRQFREGAVSLYPLNELFQILGLASKASIIQKSRGGGHAMRARPHGLCL